MPSIKTRMTNAAAFLRGHVGPLDACPGYSWRTHFLVLAPLLAVTLLVGLTQGWWGQPVWDVYEPLRLEQPLITKVMRFISAWSSPFLYAVYIILLSRGIAEGMRDGPGQSPNVFLPQGIPREWWGASPAMDYRLGLRYIVFSLLITLLATQLLKYGLGMPRPSYPWPPRPLAFSLAYNSFPSGHTTEIVASALPLAFRFRNRPARVSLALLVLLVGYSRIWLGRHHPVDILAGMVLGSLAARLICTCSGEERSLHDPR